MTAKLYTTVITLALLWGAIWTLGYLVLAAKAQGPGDGFSWLLALLFAWGPAAAVAGGRAWFGWLKGPE